MKKYYRQQHSIFSILIATKVPNHTTPHQTKPNHTTPNHTTPHQTKLHHTTPQHNTKEKPINIRLPLVLVLILVLVLVLVINNHHLIPIKKIDADVNDDFFKLITLDMLFIHNILIKIIQIYSGTDSLLPDSRAPYSSLAE